MFNLKKSIMVAVCAALLTVSYAGAAPVGVTPGDRPAPVKSSDSYPQMYTDYMLMVMPDIEHQHEVKFLGSYLDGFGNMIWWIQNHNTDTCHAYGRVGREVRAFKSCGAAYEAYRLVCKQLGNCQ